MTINSPTARLSGSAASLEETRRRYTLFGSALTRALEEATEEAFRKLDFELIKIFKVDEHLKKLGVQGEKLQADIKIIQRHHDALTELADKITAALDEFDDHIPECTHSRQCHAARKALLEFEDAVTTGP